MNMITQFNQKENSMTSFDLFDMVNEIRVQHGESKIRLSDFNNRINDELDGEYYENFVVQNLNNTTSKGYRLTIEQCTLVGMRESKGVRKNVLNKLKQLEANQQLPQDYPTALRELANLYEQLQLQAPKVNFYDKLADRTTLMNATQVAQKISMSAQKLNKILDTLNVYSHAVKRGRVFKQWFIDQGYGELKETDLGYSQAMFTTKGEQWVFEQLTSEGII